MAAKKSTAVDTRTAEVATTQAEWIDRFLETAKSLIPNGDDFVARTIESMMGARTLEDLFGTEDEAAVTSLKDITGTVFRIDGANLIESEYEESSLPCYVVMHTSIGPVSSGALEVVVAVVQAATNGLLPVWVKSTERKTKAGNTVRRLVRATDAEVAAAEALAESQSGSF